MSANQDAEFSKTLNFFFGCVVVFVGVWILTRTGRDHEVEIGELIPQEIATEGPSDHLRFTTPVRPVAISTRSSGSLRRRQSNDYIGIGSSGSIRRLAPRTISAGYLLIGASPRNRHLFGVYDHQDVEEQSDDNAGSIDEEAAG